MNEVTHNCSNSAQGEYSDYRLLGEYADLFRQQYVCVSDFIGN